MRDWFLAAMLATSAMAQIPEGSAMVQTAELDASKPYFIPSHPRVATTIRFPQEIGAPEGRGFVEEVATRDASEVSDGEYLVSWQQGDAYLTVSPLEAARIANLNVPYQGQTYVFCFYPVAEQLKALASLSLASAATVAKPSPTGAGEAKPMTATRQAEPPSPPFVPPTPARLVGLLDRLKLIHATPPGRPLADLAKAMNVEIAVGEDDAARGEKDLQGRLVLRGIAGIIRSSRNDAGLFHISLLRAVRDHRMNCLGFVCLIRNVSSEVIAFDVNSFGVRAGAEYLSSRVSDATPILQPGEQSPAYFVIQSARNAPLSAMNDWRISVDLVSPRLNPGAMIARGFSRKETPQ